MACQITKLTIVYSTVCSGTYQRKHQSSASLAFVRGIHRSPVNSPHKWPVTRKMFPFDDVMMSPFQLTNLSSASAIQAVLTPSLVRVDTMSAANGLGWSILKVHVIIVLILSLSRPVLMKQGPHHSDLSVLSVPLSHSVMKSEIKL